MTNFGRLAGTGQLAPTLVRLMMACNDLTLANDSLEAWHRDQTANREQRQVGAKMYFVRLQMAHLFEALSIIEHIRGAPKLSEAVAACDERTRQSFEKVSAFIGTDDYRRMARIRHNITFHYDDGAVEKALEAAAKAHPGYPLAMQMGRETIDWFFEPGDRIIDRIVVRDIFGVAPDADVRIEVDKIIGRLQEIGEAFADFAGYFVRHHTAR
jgi:hypothetical protein